MSTTAVSEKCFVNDGLKYSTRISIFFKSPTEVNGTVTSTDLGTDAKETADFTGTSKGNELTITFKGKAPVIGDASTWTDKPWIIKKDAKGNSILSIIFNSKNYETNKWSDTAFEFEVCH